MIQARGGLTRRRFLVLVAAGGTAVLAGVGLKLGLDDGNGPASDGTPAPPPPTPDAATQAIGRRYLDETPTESTEADLRAALPADLTDVTPGQETERVAVATRADFDRDRTVELDGWLLSVTECRVAALSVVA